MHVGQWTISNMANQDIQDIQENLKISIVKNFNELFLASIAPLFQNDIELKSFGWNQWYFNRPGNYQTQHTTLNRSDINGNVGILLYDVASIEKQKKVYDLISQFDPNLLRFVFGNNSSIAIYNDLSIEAVLYDPYRSDTC